MSRERDLSAEAFVELLDRLEGSVAGMASGLRGGKMSPDDVRSLQFAQGLFALRDRPPAPHLLPWARGDGQRMRDLAPFALRHAARKGFPLPTMSLGELGMVAAIVVMVGGLGWLGLSAARSRPFAPAPSTAQPAFGTQSTRPTNPPTKGPHRPTASATTAPAARFAPSPAGAATAMRTTRPAGSASPTREPDVAGDAPRHTSESKSETRPPARDASYPGPSAPYPGPSAQPTATVADLWPTSDPQVTRLAPPPVPTVEPTPLPTAPQLPTQAPLPPTPTVSGPAATSAPTTEPPTPFTERSIL